VPELEEDVKEEVDDTHQHLLNHQNVMNIQSTSSAHEFDEEYGTENEIEQSERSSQQCYQDSASSKRQALLQ